MSNGGAAAAAAAIIRAIKASGVLVRLSPEEFQTLLPRARNGIIVQARGGLFYSKYKYLISYKGLAFHTKSPEPISIPPDIETVQAKRIWAPD
jgi:hypothetical protein